MPFCSPTHLASDWYLTLIAQIDLWLSNWLVNINHLDLTRQNFSSVFRSRQKFLCPVWKKTVLVINIQKSSLWNWLMGADTKLWGHQLIKSNANFSPSPLIWSLSMLEKALSCWEPISSSHEKDIHGCIAWISNWPRCTPPRPNRSAYQATWSSARCNPIWFAPFRLFCIFAWIDYDSISFCTFQEAGRCPVCNDTIPKKGDGW